MLATKQSTKISFAKSRAAATVPQPAHKPWKVLIVDDEPQVHAVTRMALKNISYHGAKLEMLSAYSAAEAKAVLTAHPDIALILLDVVMETDDAGLDLVEYIRGDLANRSVRIILRTGQPGQAPEERVITRYDINDYKEKTELTAQKLFSVVHASLRSYRDIMALECNRKGLRKVIEASATIFRQHSLEHFAKGVLEQLTSLLYLEPESVYCHAVGVAADPDNAAWRIIAATGRYEPFIGEVGNNALSAEMLDAIETARKIRSNVATETGVYAAFVRTNTGGDNILCVQGSGPPDTTDNELIDLFCQNVSIAFDNVQLTTDLRSEVEVRTEAERKAQVLALFPEESPNPTLRIAADGTVLYANAPSGPMLEEWGIATGDALSVEWTRSIQECLAAGVPTEEEMNCGDKVFSLSLAPVVASDYVNVYGRDITEARKAHAQIEYMAYHDGLTGLPNRVYFQKRLQEELLAARRKEETVALLFIDLDHFKDINDICGHDIGDDLLQHVANKLRGIMRPSDMVARLGGDEFGVIMPDLPNGEVVDGTANRIIDSLRRPLDLNGNKVQIGCSVGITTFPQDSVNAVELQKNADLAMYQAKEQGRNTYRFYNSELHDAIQRRHRLESELREAIDKRQFELHFQPKVSLNDGNRINGAEALVRWRHPERGLVPPGDFIPVAEATGLISEIGQWVLLEACRQTKAWQDTGLDIRHIAVNLSAAQFRDRDLLRDVQSVLCQTGLEAACLELEITETVVMSEVEQTIAILSNLSRLGVGLAIDDFGTGYSSLSYLRRFPITKMKVDRAFVSDMIGNPDARAIACAVISLGHSLNLKLVAEGIETTEQADFLAEQGCHEGQGFFFSRPVPAPEFQARLSASAET